MRREQSHAQKERSWNKLSENEDKFETFYTQTNCVMEMLCAGEFLVCVFLCGSGVNSISGAKNMFGIKSFAALRNRVN